MGSGPAAEGVGDVAVIEVSDQLFGVTVMPLNVIVLEPCDAPNVVPLIVMRVPRGPLVGDMPVILGMTVNVTPLLEVPDTVTTTDPVVAPAGTGVTMLVSLQLEGTAVTPLNLTVLLPWLAPKPDPAIVTEAPTGPLVGVRLLMVGPRPNAGSILETDKRASTTTRQMLRVKVAPRFQPTLQSTSKHRYRLVDPT